MIVAEQMEEDLVFTKRFTECVKKSEEERSEQVRTSFTSLCVCVCGFSIKAKLNMFMM